MAITSSMTASFKTEILGSGHCLQGTVTPTGSATSGSFTVTSVSSMAGVAVGMNVSGTNIPTNTVVARILSSTSFTLSQATTGVISTGTLTISGDAFFCALIKASPSGTYGAATTNYSNVVSNTDEVASGSGYTTGGVALTNLSPANNGTSSFVSFGSNPSWTSATFTTAGCIIYNSSDRINGTTGAALAVFDFGGTQTVTAGTFTVQLPTDAAGTAVLQIT